LSKYLIVRIITRLIIGGPTLHTVLLTNSFSREQDFDSLLVCGQKNPGERDMYYLADQYYVKPYYIEDLGREINLTREVKSIYKVYKLLKEVKPEIVHTHTAKAGLVGRLAAWMAGVPVIVHTYHGHIYGYYFGAMKTYFFLTLERLMALISDAIIAISPRQAEELARLRLGAKKIKVIPLGFDFSRIINGQKGFLRKRIGLQKDVFLVGIVGRLVPVKNHELFLNAAKIVAGNCRHKNVRFVIIGDGEIDYRKSLEKKAEELDLTQKVIFAGWQEEMASVYQDLDLLVLTSLNEGTPVTIIEAMAAGCPVVSTDVGGVADVVEHGISGLLAPSGDAEALADHMLKLLEDDKLREEIEQNAKEKVLEKYSVARLHDDLRELYMQILNDKRKVKNNHVQSSRSG